MRWAVFSDIHSNAEAFAAVLEAVGRERVDGYVCCGDVVGYGAEPNETLRLASGLSNLHCVRGNHDLAVLGRMDLSWFNGMAAESVRYAQAVLTEENRRWLQDLPPRIDHSEFTLVHGSPRNPAEEYLVTVQQFHDNTPHYAVSPCFVGHSHLPLVFLMKEPVSYVEFSTLQADQQVSVPRGMRVVINSGSVGQPRDHDPRAAYGIYDDEQRLFTLRRVEYDVQAAQRKILEAGLPEFLAMRLLYGQ
ncbi:MAG: metallophosphoesterase family protein [Elusimicrobiota bacterium]|jgi:diadenosine tetraphosphatase ApaH/serine/threonine PP2A family protein phosphatase